MNPIMTYSVSGRLLTQSFESCRYQAYRDGKGVLTIGWGHTAGVRDGDLCTQVQADAWLLTDVQNAVYAVNHYVVVGLDQAQFDALVDFVFNIGTGNFARSTLLRLLNAGDLAGAAKEFERWDESGGVVVAGLLRRRIAEEKEFDDGTPGIG